MNTQVKSSTRSPGATLLIEWRCSEARDMVQIDTNNGQNDFGSLSQKKKDFGSQVSQSPHGQSLFTFG